MRRESAAIGLAGLLLLNGALGAQEERKRLPREDVVEIPAIGEGLSVSNLFQSRMVLQRDKPIHVWGWADPGESVAVSFGGRSTTALAGPDRAWKAVLDPLPAERTPRAMEIKGARRTLTLDDVLVGDVWLLGGQSNMEWPIANTDDGPLEIASANFPQIRLLTLPQGKGFDSVRSFERLHEWSDWSGRHFRKGDWEACTPQTVQEFSAIGYVFGRRLQMAAQVPIGLIDASIGGTTVETWTPEDVIRRIEGRETRDKLKSWDEKIAAYDPQEDLKRRIARFEQDRANAAKQGRPFPADRKPPTGLLPGPKADRNRPGYCYAGVIRPLEGLSIKGAVWHQGFNNCFDGSAGARMYYQVFAKMIGAWRAAFGDPKLPFCIISLCTAGEPQTEEHFAKPMYDAGTFIREAHHRTFMDLRAAGDVAVGYVSSFDLRKSFYHPQIKIPAGERAAKWALATQYGLLKDEHWLPPMIRDVKRVDGTLRLTMSTEIRLKDESDDQMRGFAVAGEDRRFYPAETRYFSDGTLDGRKQPVQQKNVLVLRSPHVPQPVHYRYAWARNPIGNLASSRQIPLPAQRSDDWALEETPTRFPGWDDPAQERRIRGLLVKELDLIDLERRIRDAEALLAELKPKFAAEQEAWSKRKASELQKGKPEEGR
jgi:sialate O-acetylesterase